MSKPSTDPGLGPPASGSEPAAKKTDTVDDILDGFGTARADQPRILPRKGSDITPTPPDVGARKELTPTEPGSRQKKSRFMVASIAGFIAVLILGIVFVKMTSGGPVTDAPVPTPATATAKSTAAMTPAAVMPTETAIPTVDTVAPVPSATVSAKPTATAKTTASAPSAKPSATTTVSGDAPGLHLIKGL